MIPITDHQRCRCTRPVRSGTRYFGREACGICRRFLVGRDEAEALKVAARKAERAASPFTMPASHGLDIPILDADDVLAIVGRHLDVTPELTQQELRFALMVHGRYVGSEPAFARIVQEARKARGIIPKVGRKATGSVGLRPSP